MSLRNKFILLLLSVFMAFFAIAYAVQTLIIYPSFVDLERSEAAKDLDRTVQALSRELEVIAPSVGDWASWDDTYQFMLDHNQAYIDANLDAATLQGLNINLLAFYAEDGRRVWGMTYDLINKQSLEIGEFSSDRLPPIHPLLTHRNRGGGVAGIYRTSQGPMLVVTRPVLTSDGKGPPRGTAMMGRLVDDAAIRRLSDQARVQLEVERLAGDAAMPIAAPGDGMIPHTPVELRADSAYSHAYSTLADLTGRPVLRFMSRCPGRSQRRDAKRSTLRRCPSSVLGRLCFCCC